MNIRAKLFSKSDTQQISDSFSKREFVAITEYESKYPQPILFTLTKDKCSMIDSFKPEDIIDIDFNIRGREWSGPNGLKYFTTLEVWKISKV